MPSGRAAKTKPKRNTTSPIAAIGLVFMAIGVYIAASTFWPVLLVELGYDLKHIVPNNSTKQRPIEPVDRTYGIVIPKIGANAHVIADVNPFDPIAYQRALTKGVAQARGTGIPGKGGNIFLFSHSSVNFYEASRYNSVFYLLTKMEKDDRIIVYYHNERYLYAVTATYTVKPTDVRFLTENNVGEETVTLMTCWPPGTSYERLLVIAERIK